MLFKSLFNVLGHDRNRTQRCRQFMSSTGRQCSQCFDFVAVGLQQLGAADLDLLVVEFVGQPSQEVHDHASAGSEGSEQALLHDRDFARVANRF